MGWIDNIVVTIIVIAGVFILYKALKEPADLLFRLIGRGFGSIRDKMVDAKDAGGDYYGEIRYG